MLKITMKDGAVREAEAGISIPGNSRANKNSQKSTLGRE